MLTESNCKIAAFGLALDARNAHELGETTHACECVRAAHDRTEIVGDRRRWTDGRTDTRDRFELFMLSTIAHRKSSPGE